MKSNTITPAALAAAAAGDVENFLAAATPGGIEAQEAREQQRATATFDRLPKEVHGATWDQLKALGFKVLGDLDDIFYRIEAPAGWSIRPTEHSMHSDVLDAKGRIRMGMFYKGAFYDRRAHLNVRRRFRTQQEWAKTNDFAFVEDLANPKSPPAFKVPIPDGSNYTESAEIMREVEAWLDAHYPNHKDALAYWD